MKALDIARVLAVLGVRAERRGGSLWASCPLPGHRDSTPSWSILASGERAGNWYCHGCGRGGGPVELVVAIRGMDRDAAREWLRSYERTSWSAPIIEVSARIPARLRRWPLVGAEPSFVSWPERARRHWEEKRGLPAHLARDVSAAATGPECSQAPMSIVFPVVSFGALRTWVGRSYVPTRRSHYQASRDDGAQPDLALWGEPWLDPSTGPALVCEGIYDALSLTACGLRNAVAVLGAHAITPAKVAAVARGGAVVICTDADVAGDAAADSLSRALARHCRVERARPPEGHDWGSAPVRAIVDVVGDAATRLRRAA